MPELSITLPNDMASAVRAKVEAGEYATESEVINDGLRMLLERDQAVESWLHNQIGPTCDSLKENSPAQALAAGRTKLEAGYKAMAADEEYETEAREWVQRPDRGFQ